MLYLTPFSLSVQMRVLRNTCVFIFSELGIRWTTKVEVSSV